MQDNFSRRTFLRAGLLAGVGWVAGCVPAANKEGDGPEKTAPTNTSSPIPPPTDAPTHTVVPTATDPPTATATDVPTYTPMPTSTRSVLSTTTSTPAPTGTATPAPTDTPDVTPTPAPTATPLSAALSREDLLAHYPQTAGSVVSLIQHDGVWDGDRIQPHVVLEMLDAAITQLTDIQDAITAWRALFDPGEVIGIKVNTISRYTTAPETAYAITQRLQDAGIPAEQIVLFDRTERELVARGFKINDGGPDVQCRGAKAWDQPTTVAGTTQRLHDAILSCDALINVPALKEHGTSGFTSALKNHYGTVNSPNMLHGNNCDPAIPELNALPVIQEKTRLIVGDLIRICPYNWNQMTRENVIAMSFDPVAHDVVARQVLIARRVADNRPADYISGRSHYLETAVRMGLGADAAHAEVRKATLG